MSSVFFLLAKNKTEKNEIKTPFFSFVPSFLPVYYVTAVVKINFRTALVGYTHECLSKDILASTDHDSQTKTEDDTQFSITKGNRSLWTSQKAEF